MSITPGTRIGVYEIVSALGAGGMGEVYRARDTRLSRDIAIKVLPEAFGSDADRAARFTREAQVLASLNHPNIAQIYGIEQNALVMELVEGEDLSATIAHGPLALSDALPVAAQIADALEAAHELGIVHRDLKPANIKVRADGTVKVLDFGLAKAMDLPGAEAPGLRRDAADSPTMTSPAMTGMGMILGTAAYMSPEQAKGRAVDKRADIWAFGAVLYEMLTGRRAFNGDGVSELLASVLKDPVDFSALPPTVPPRLRALVERCLERDVKLRLRDIGEARVELAKIADGRTDLSLPGIATAGSPRASRLPWAIAALGVVAALAMTAVYLTRPAQEPPEGVVFELNAPGMSSVYAISPDGRHIIYRTATSPAMPDAQLWLRALGSLEATPLPETKGAQGAGIGVVWSPDGRAAVFSGPTALMRVDVSTGQTTEVLKPRLGAQQFAGGWSRDGGILYGQRSRLESDKGGVWRVADTPAATPVRVTELRYGDILQLPSGFLPDGRHFLYLSVNSSDGSPSDLRIGSIDVAPADQRADVLLTADGPAVYAQGFLLFVSRGSLMAQPFDAERLTLAGAPTVIATGVASTISASATGHLVYRAGDSDRGGITELIRFGRDGRVLSKIGPPAVYGEVSAMAGGRSIVVSRTDRDAPDHLHIVDLARGTFNRLNPGNVRDYAGESSPDDMVAFTYSPEGVSRDIYVRASNGVGEARVLVASGTVKHPNGWSPDGQFLMYDDHSADRFQDLALVRRDGGAPIPFLSTDADETLGQFSPDGQWIVYRSTESGRPEIYVRDFAPGRSPAYGTEKIPISANAGDKPRWSADGREIYYFQGNTLMSVPVRTGKPFQVGTAVPLFDTATSGYVPYDVLPDGTFVVNVPVPTSSGVGAPLKVLLNWQSALRKAVK